MLSLYEGFGLEEVQSKHPKRMHTKTVVAVGTLICFAMSACEKTETPAPPEASSETTPEPPRAGQDAPAPTSSTGTPPSPATAQAATPAPKLAPEGVFYLVQKVSVETDAGIVGLNPGTKAVRQPDGRFLADGHTVNLQPSQMTNDLTLAQQAMSTDQSSQQRIRQVMAARAAATPPPAKATPTPRKVAATRQSAPSRSRESGQFSKEYVDPTAARSSGVQPTSSLNARHTRTGEGFLWQKSPDGEWWVPVKPLNGRDNQMRPPNKRVQ